jgi:cation transport ATPase
MVQRSLVSLLATLGGILVILGGILGFLLSIGPGMFGPHVDGGVGGLVLGVVAGILGLVILFYSGFTHIQGIRRGASGGLILIVLGIVTWVVVGQWVLVSLGAFLTLLAGVVLLIEVIVADPRSRTAASP